MQIPAQVNLTAGVSGQQQVDRLGKSIENVGRQARVSANVTAQAFAQLPVQLQDLAVQIAGGQNPLLALFQQGTQVSGAFGGIGNAARAIGATLTPARLAIGGVATAAVTMAAAFVSGSNESAALARSLELSGNQAGITAGQFEQMAARVREATGATAGATRDLLSGAAGSGAFGPASIEAAASAMARLQRLSGQSSEEIVKDFAKMRSGVAQWAAEHNRQYAYLTAATFAQIRALEQQGKVEEALRLNVEELDKALAGREVQLGWLERGWKAVAGAASAAWDAMKGVGRPDSTIDQLKSLEQELANNMMRSFGETAIPGLGPSPNDALRARIAALRSAINMEQLNAQAVAASAAEERKRIEDIQSGFDGKMQDLQFAARLQALKAASEARLQLLEREKAEVEALQAAGLMNEQGAAQRRLDIRQRELAEQAALVRAEIALEAQRPMSGDKRLAEQERANRIAALQSRLSILQGQSGIEAVLGSADVTKARIENEKTWAKEYADAWKTANDFLLRLRQQNERGAVALIADPQQRARAEVETAIRDIQSQMDSATRDLEAELVLSTDPAQVARIKQQLADIKAAASDAMDMERAKLPGSKSWLDGLQAGFYEWRDTALDIASQVKEAFTISVNGMADAFTQWAVTGKSTFKDFARSVIADITRMIVRWTMLQAAQGFMSLFGGGSAAPFSANNYGPAAEPAFAKGGAFANGIVSVPTGFSYGAGRRGVMGEAGPEAIMPLRRTSSGDLGVQVTGGGGVTIGSIIVQGNGAPTVQDTSGEKAAALGRDLANAVDQRIIYHQRPGGLLAA